MEYLFKPYYLDSYSKDKTYKIEGNIFHIKPFQKDKLIILTNYINIFDIKNYKILCRILPSDNIIYTKSEPMKKGKFILLNNSFPNTVNLGIYQLIKDELTITYTCNKVNAFQINLTKINNILNWKNKIILIGDNIFNIYKYFNGNLVFQTKIHSRMLYPMFSPVFGFKFNNNIIGLFEGISLEFYNLKKCSFIQKGELHMDIFILLDKNVQIESFNNDDHVLFGFKNQFYIYSFKINRAVAKIDCPYNIKAIKVSIHNTIFVLDENNISLLNLKKFKLYKLNKRKGNFGKHLIVANHGFITDSRDGNILFYKYSKYVKYKVILIDLIIELIILFICFIIIKYMLRFMPF